MSWSCCCWEVVADLCGWWVTETNDSTHAFCPSTNHACHMAYLAGCWEVLCHDTNNAFNAPSSLSLLFLIYLSFFFFNPSFCFFATLSISDIGIIIAMKIRTWHWVRIRDEDERKKPLKEPLRPIWLEWDLPEIPSDKSQQECYCKRSRAGSHICSL